MKKFNIFGTKNWDSFAGEKLNAIGLGIERMPDEEIASYNDNIEPLIEKLVSVNRINDLAVKFQEKKASTLEKPIRQYKRIYVVYSVPVSGNAELLKICPYASGPHFDILAELSENNVNFEYDTNFHGSDDFPENIKRKIKMNYESLKDTITNSTRDLNNAFQEFNASLPEFIKPRLEMRLKKINEKTKTKNFLDNL